MTRECSGCGERDCDGRCYSESPSADELLALAVAKLERDYGLTEVAQAKGRSMNPERSAFGMVIDELLRSQEQRHAWLFKAAAQIRRWREIDRLQGINWGDESTARNAPAKGSDQ